MDERLGPPRRFDWQEVQARLEAALESNGERPPDEVARILEERARKLARPKTSAPAPTQVLELLVFSLGKEGYGIDTASVLDVIRVHGLTPLPCVPDFVMGVIHHRGRILPVLDLRRLLGLEGRQVGETGCVVSLEVRAMSFGILADTVTGIVRAAAEELAPPPSGGGGGRRTLLRGVTKDRVAVLDVEALAADTRLVINEEVR
jgi:purine-binding chemotaxis protein CheW